MNLRPASLPFLQRLSAVLAFCCLLTVPWAASAHTGYAQPSASRQLQSQDLLTQQERSAIPRKAILQTKLTPQQKRHKHLGGSKDKSFFTAEIRRVSVDASRVSLLCPTIRLTSRASSWRWQSRAPPFRA
jgi:hypothetical protein